MQTFMNIYANYDPIIVRCPGKVKRERALQFQLGFAAAGGVGGQFHARLLEHEPCRDAGIAVVVLVAVVHHLGNAGLDDGLGTLVAGEEGHIDPCALQVVVSAVQDGIQLGMADVHIFCVQRVALADSQGAADFLGDYDAAEVVPLCQVGAKKFYILSGKPFISMVLGDPDGATMRLRGFDRLCYFRSKFDRFAPK